VISSGLSPAPSLDGSQFLLSEITNANISVRENFDIALPLYTLTNELSDENWSYSICIGSTESANQKVGTLVIGKNDLIIDKEGVVNLDISWSFL
jgi:hypothetical protein